MKNLFTHDIFVRALKTFIQAALASIIVSLATVNDIQTAKVAAVAALSAGISAVWNFFRATV